MKKITLLTIAFLASTSFAAQMKVIQVSRDKSQTLFELSGNEIKAGDIVKIGDQCEAEVIQAGVLKGLADTSVCKSDTDIQVSRNVSLMTKGPGYSTRSQSFASTNNNQVIQDATSSQYKVVAEKPYNPEDYLMNGFGAGLLFGSMSGSAEGTYKYESGVEFDVSETSDSTATNAGAAISYAYLPKMSVGFMGKLNIFKVDMSTESSTAIRGDLNVAFAASRLFYGFVGINTFTATGGGDLYEKLSGGIGYQLGAGVQITKKIDVDLSYTVMKANLSETMFDQQYNQNVEITSANELSVIGGSVNYRF